mgnify:CR=1 FL=1
MLRIFPDLNPFYLHKGEEQFSSRYGFVFISFAMYTMFLRKFLDLELLYPKVNKSFVIFEMIAIPIALLIFILGIFLATLKNSEQHRRIACSKIVLTNSLGKVAPIFVNTDDSRLSNPWLSHAHRTASNFSRIALGMKRKYARSIIATDVPV